MFQEVLGTLKPFRQLLLQGLLDDPGAGEADDRPRLGDDDVPQHGEAGRNPAGGRIGKNGNIGQTVFL